MSVAESLKELMNTSSKRESLIRTLRELVAAERAEAERLSRRLAIREQLVRLLIGAAEGVRSSIQLTYHKPLSKDDEEHLKYFKEFCEEHGLGYSESSEAQEAQLDPGMGESGGTYPLEVLKVDITFTC
jgi:hypothetical protein